jgi:hypothetical protein
MTTFFSEENFLLKFFDTVTKDYVYLTVYCKYPQLANMAHRIQMKTGYKYIEGDSVE